ncbi:GNAT family N-acetyltransferase [Chengkuizengella sediminis]|uniref:GNAT family N-acetyltransferase n=1 Tax=Chengkuizengella sediminis TaxID=1885917 RepID=UPI00138A0114|nr:hypothetical protein [Chengkuizengella sediminis]NDI33591.1 hypothetical protein [Chengkuizengella sediminis]
MNIVSVDSRNKLIYLNLCQSYEGEFSALTEKLPNTDGVFKLDTILGVNIEGFLLYEKEIPIGLAAVRKSIEDFFEVCEFYVIPSCRKKDLGRKFAHHLFSIFKGQWQVKQIEGAEYATTFWRKVIGEFTSGEFEEDVYMDFHWGKVTRQRFTSV